MQKFISKSQLEELTTQPAHVIVKHIPDIIEPYFLQNNKEDAFAFFIQHLSSHLLQIPSTFQHYIFHSLIKNTKLNFSTMFFFMKHKKIKQQFTHELQLQHPHLYQFFYQTVKHYSTIEVETIFTLWLQSIQQIKQTNSFASKQYCFLCCLQLFFYCNTVMQWNHKYDLFLLQWIVSHDLYRFHQMEEEEEDHSFFFLDQLTQFYLQSNQFENECIVLFQIENRPLLQRLDQIWKYSKLVQTILFYFQQHYKSETPSLLLCYLEHSTTIYSMIDLFSSLTSYSIQYKCIQLFKKWNDKYYHLWMDLCNGIQFTYYDHIYLPKIAQKVELKLQEWKQETISERMLQTMYASQILLDKCHQFAISNHSNYLLALSWNQLQQCPTPSITCQIILYQCIHTCTMETWQTEYLLQHLSLCKSHLMFYFYPHFFKNTELCKVLFDELIKDYILHNQSVTNTIFKSQLIQLKSMSHLFVTCVIEFILALYFDKSLTPTFEGKDPFHGLIMEWKCKSNLPISYFTNLIRLFLYEYPFDELERFDRTWLHNVTSILFSVYAKQLKNQFVLETLQCLYKWSKWNDLRVRIMIVKHILNAKEYEESVHCDALWNALDYSCTDMECIPFVMKQFPFEQKLIFEICKKLHTSKFIKTCVTHPTLWNVIMETSQKSRVLSYQLCQYMILKKQNKEDETLLLDIQKQILSHGNFEHASMLLAMLLTDLVEVKTRPSHSLFQPSLFVKSILKHYATIQNKLETEIEQFKSQWSTIFKQHISAEQFLQIATVLLQNESFDLLLIMLQVNNGQSQHTLWILCELLLQDLNLYHYLNEKQLYYFLEVIISLLQSTRDNIRTSASLRFLVQKNDSWIQYLLQQKQVPTYPIYQQICKILELELKTSHTLITESNLMISFILQVRKLLSSKLLQQNASHIVDVSMIYKYLATNRDVFDRFTTCMDILIADFVSNTFELIRDKQELLAKQQQHSIFVRNQGAIRALQLLATQEEDLQQLLSYGMGVLLQRIDTNRVQSAIVAKLNYNTALTEFYDNLLVVSKKLKFITQ